MPTAVLAPQVHAALIGDDLVLLDVRADAYSVLAGFGRACRLDGRTLTGDDGELLEDLAEADLVRSVGDPETRDPLPRPPARATSRRDVSIGARDAARLACAAARTAWDMRRLALEDLVRRPPPTGTIEEAALARDVALFEAGAPWIPGQGVCLWRCRCLLTLFGPTAAGTTWVFGVRTWPFQAHCWLQAGDLLLGDDLDRVRLYTPILAV